MFGASGLGQQGTFENHQFWLEVLFQENCFFNKRGLFQKLVSLLNTKRTKEKFPDSHRNNIMKQYFGRGFIQNN